MLFIRTGLIVLFAMASTASAQALDVHREEVRAFIKTMSQEHGFKSSELRKVLKAAETKQSILDAISRPAERAIPWYEYRERFLTPQRIAKGVSFMQQHVTTLERLRATGAPVAEILGILGVETIYGENVGRYRVIDALATLAFDYPPRGDFFRSELEQFLLLTRELGIAPEQPMGSYAGAMGPPQFISSSYRNYAVDGDGDGARDLWRNWNDVLASIANYLAQFGWRSGEPVMAEAVVADPAAISAFGSGREMKLDETVASLRSKGVRFETTLPADAPALVFVLQGKDGPEYRVGFNNFYVLTRYNRSTLYASAVHELGQAIVQTPTVAGNAP